jgi:uncharacterized protein YndB with AHSA1/START domain
MSESLRFEEVFAAPRERVFAYFSEPEKLGRLWGGRWKRLSAGQDPAEPNGLGSVRELRVGAFTFEETIVAWQPGELIEYRMTRGPVKAHLGRIVFADAPGGTRVHYSVDFESKVPGTGRMFAATMRLSWRVGVPRVARDLARVDG